MIIFKVLDPSSTFEYSRFAHNANGTMSTTICIRSKETFLSTVFCVKIYFLFKLDKLFFYNREHKKEHLPILLSRLARDS